MELIVVHMTKDVDLHVQQQEHSGTITAINTPAKMDKTAGETLDIIVMEFVIVMMLAVMQK